MGNFKFMFSFIKKYRIKVFYGALLIILLPIISLPIPLLMKNLIDVYIPSKVIFNITNCCILIIILFIISKFFSYISSRLFYTINCQIVQDIRTALFERFFNSQINNTKEYTKSEIVTIIEDDIKKVDIFFVNQLANITKDIITLIVSIIMLIKISFLMSSISFVAMFFYVIITKYFKNSIESIYLKYMKSVSDSKSELIESVNNSNYIKFNHYEKFTIDRYTKTTKAKMDLNIKRGKISITGSSIMEFISGSLPFISLLLGGILVAKNKLTIGSVIAFNTYLSNFITPINNLTAYNFNYHEAVVSINRMREIYNLQQTSSFLKKYNFSSLKINNVNVAKNNIDILKNINFEIHKGDKFLIFGPSGSGKTTLLNTILGLENINNGEVKFMDFDNKKYNLFCSYINSEAFVFNDNAYNNIFFNNEPDNEKLYKIMNMLNISKDLLDKTNNAKTFSHGQRQKLNLLRALYYNQDFLIIDEGLSNIDPNDLNKIILGLLKIDSLTLIIVSHNIQLKNLIQKQILLEEGVIKQIIL